MTDPATAEWREAMGASTSAQLRQTQQALAASQADLTRVEGERDRATGLLEYALHLRMHGERAPGGDETWAEFDQRCEHFLRNATSPRPTAGDPRD
jgi:hypothetical protein